MRAVLYGSIEHMTWAYLQEGEFDLAATPTGSRHHLSLLFAVLRRAAASASTERSTAWNPGRHTRLEGGLGQGQPLLLIDARSLISDVRIVERTDRPGLA